MKGKQINKNTFPLKTNQSVGKRELINYIGDYHNMNKQKSKRMKYDKVSLKYSNLQIIKQINRSRNQYFSPHSSIDFKKSQNEHKPNRTQLLLNNTKDAYKINVVRNKVYHNSLYLDMNDDLKSNPEDKSNVIINSFKEARTVTSKQSTVSNSKQKEMKGTTAKVINLSKKKFNDLSFNNDISFSRLPSYKKYNSNEVGMTQLTHNTRVNNNNANMRKTKCVYRQKSMHLSSSIDLSTRRNKSFLNPLLNESIGTSCLTKNAPLNKENTQLSLQAEGIEDIHFKMVEVYQKKKLFYVNIAIDFGVEGEEISNDYLEKE